MVDYGGAVLPLSIDESALQRQLAGVLTSFKGLGNQVDGVMANLGRFAIAATGLYALKKAFDATTGAALSFNQQLMATWAVAGDLSKRELRALGGEVRNLARQFNMTSTEAQHAMYEINQSVFYGADALEILKESAKGAAAGMTDVYTVADMMTTVLNAYNMSATKSSHVNDILFQTVLYGKITMEELSNEFGRLAGVAAPVGASLEEISAGIATLTRLGIDADTAVTSLRQTMFQIMRPTKALKDAISSYGYATGRAMIEANGFAKSLQMLVDYGEKAGIEMELLFSNVRAVLGVLPLTSTAADEYAADLNRMADSAGVANTAFKKVTSSWLYQLENTKVILNDLAISFGQMLIPAIQAFLKTLQMLLTPLAHMAELLGQIGGQQTVAAITVVGALTLAFVGLRKALVALEGFLILKATGIGQMLATLGGGGGVTGSLLKGAGLLGLGILGIGSTIKGITVDLPIALDPKVTGAEKVKAALQTALETSLGAALGGAIFGKMLGLGMGAGAGIGLGLAAAAAITVLIIHEVRKGAAEQKTLEGIAREVAGGMSLPLKIPQDSLLKTLDELEAKLLSMSEELRAAGGAGRVAAQTVIRDLYDREASSAFGAVTLVLEEGFARIREASRALGIALSEQDLEQLISKWRATLEEAIPSGLSGISDYIKSRLPEGIKDALDVLDSTVSGDLDAAGFAQFMDSLREKIGKFIVSVTGGVSQADIDASVALWQEFFNSLSGMQSEEELRRARARIQQWFSLITKGFSNKEMGAFAIRLGEAGMSFEALDEVFRMLGTDTATLKTALLGLWEEAQATNAVIPTTSSQIVAARTEFTNLFRELKAEDITISGASDKFKTLSEMADKWAEYAEIAERFGLHSADAIKALANQMEELVGDAENAATAIDRFAQALQAVALAAGASSQIQGIFADMQKLLVGASTLGEAAQIMGALQSGQGSVEAFKTGLEQIFAPDSTYAQESKEWARQTWSQIGDQFPKLGSSLAELTESAKKLAEEQKRSAEASAQAAAEAAEEAYRAEQQAFKNQFIRPALDAVATGDFAGAARQIDSLRDNFAGLVNQGAKLGVSATDVLGMITSARSELLSAIDGLIEVNSQYPDIVEALQYAKKEISEMWAAPKTALEKSLSGYDIYDLFSDPAGVAATLRELAQQDVKVVSKYMGELASKLQEEIDARALLGYSTKELEDALQTFKAALTGTVAPFQRFMNALDKFSAGIVELADALIPGFGTIVGKIFDLGNAIAKSGGIAWRNGKPVAMAEGGIATSPTLALIGEAGPEAVIPLSNISNLPSFTGGGMGDLLSTPGFMPTAQPDIAAPGFATDTSTFTLDQSFAKEVIGSFTEQIRALGAQIVSAAMSLAEAISASVITITSSFAAVPVSNFPETPSIQSDATIEAGFAQPEQTEPKYPSLETANFEIQQSLAEGVENVVDEFHQGARELAEAAAIWKNEVAAQAGGALQPIPEIPTFDATPGAVDGFDPDIIAQALAKALTAAGITPGKPAAETTGLPALAEMLFDPSSIFNTGVSVAVSVIKALSSFAKEQQAKLAKRFKDAANVLWGALKTSGDLISQAAGELSTLFSRLVSMSSRLVTGFASLVSQTEQYQRIQSGLQSIQQKIFGAMLGFLWPVVALFDKLIGSTEDLNDSFSSLNVPTGYKVTRAEWMAAKPGEPGVKKSDEAGGLPGWVQKLMEKFGDAIKKALKPFQDFITLLGRVAEKLGPAILEGILPAFEKFGKNLLKLGEKIEAELLPLLEKHLPGVLSGALDFFFGAITGVATLFVDTLINILPNLEKFALAIGKIGDELPALFGAVADGLDKPLNDLLASFTGLADRVREELIPQLAEELPGIVEGVGSLIAGFFSGLGDMTLDLTTKLLPGIGDLAKELGIFGDKLPGLIDSIGQALAPVLADLTFGLTGVAGWINETLLPDLQGYFSNFGSWWETDVSPFLRDEVFPKISEWGNALWQVFKNLVDEVGGPVWDWLKSDAWNALSEFGDVLVEFLKKIGQWIVDNKDTLLWLLETYLGNLMAQLNRLQSQLDVYSNSPFAETIKNMAATSVLKTLPGYDASISASDSNSAFTKREKESTATAKPAATAPSVSAIAGAWSNLKYGSKTIAEMLAGIGIAGDMAGKIAGGWKSAGRAEIEFASMMNYITSRSQLKSVLAAGKLANVGGLPTWNGFSVPGLKKGGFTLSEGLAYLHRHEFVIPAKTASLAAAGVGNMTMHNYVVLDGRVVAESVNKTNGRRESRATGGPGGRRWS